MPAEQPPVPRDGLPVTALYTAGVWAWSRRPGAELYTSPATARVFGVVEVVLRVARWFVRNAPSLRHGLVQRHVMLDALVADARADGLSHGVELAAGLSPRGAARTAEPGWSWTEVDLPPVVAYKTALLDRSEAGRAVAARPSLQRLAADLREDWADLPPPDGPAMLLAEGLLMYLDDAERRTLFRRVAAHLSPHGGRFAFDLVPAADKPPPGRIARLLGAWMRRFTGGEGIVDDRTTADDIATALREAGFAEVRTWRPDEAPADWQVPHLDQPTEQRVFLAIRSPEAP